jgi:adenine-specific DNA-methyltransferase
LAAGGTRWRSIPARYGTFSSKSEKGDRANVLRRKPRELENDALDAWFRKQGYNTKDQEYDVIYVNGDNNLENLRKADQAWKVRLIEEEFRRLMFDAADV